MERRTVRPSRSARVSRWLIIADSLALPRPGVAYEHTWPKLLSDAVPQVDWINRGMRGATTERLSTDGDGGGDCLEFYEPDGVILHLGICDAAPRLFSRKSLAMHLIYRLPFGINRKLSTWLERHGGRRIRNAWVSAPQFERNLEEYLIRAQAHHAKVLALYILPVGSRMLMKNPLIARQIEIYNAIYDRLAERHCHLSIVRIFDSSNDIEEFFIDGYHLNEAGGRRVAEVLTSRLAGTGLVG